MEMVERISRWWNGGIKSLALCVSILVGCGTLAGQVEKVASAWAGINTSIADHGNRLDRIEKQNETMSYQIQSLQEQVSRIEDRQLHRTTKRKRPGDLSTGFSGPTPQQ